MGAKRDILIRTGNPKMLDSTLQSFGGAALGGPDNIKMIEGCVVIRCLGSDQGAADSIADFISRIVDQQGYGEFVRQLEEE